MDILSVVKLMRPHQYIKNLFIFLPLFFAMKITDITLLSNAFFAFIAFSFTASAVYTLNDYHDIQEDKQHPKKKNRPLASGAITKPQAIAIMGILSTLGFLLMTALSWEAAGILLAYVVMNIAYSFYFKHIAILDVTIIAIGFVLRLFIGSAVTDVPLSMWIVVMTFLLALFMALAKRRDDVLIYLDTGKKMRRVIDGYNLQFLDTAMAIMASVVIVAYTIYTTSPEVVYRTQSSYLYITALFVILGVMRYLQIAFIHKNSGSPTKIMLKDHFMQLVLFGWIITFAWILY
ncbi:UbiA prenyltransferase family protein [Sulfurovum sp. NBC37-1]|uniref:UbiA prenyltransferase family protein n=1 Tax=Sulfurovum sp. (strain NBC37-1) TaxID=387093 RepID=UPI0001587706|nr:UbiA prenyltransferase family protein [Sulfurovum sp. NBC37-1]BAF71290.1 UbiA prenyltransferase family protein [Sulfurovum sp. NBC37-1]